MKRKMAIIFCVFCMIGTMYAQQAPQFTQYMYAAQILNPAYIGSTESFSTSLLYRTQWVGFSGAPKTTSFTLAAPMDRNNKMALGLSVLHDEIGPSKQTTATIDYAYTIEFYGNRRLAFGLKAGTSVLDIDFLKLNVYSSSDPAFKNNIDYRWQPHIGAGVYYYTSRFFSGVSTPNFLETKYFAQNNNQQTIAAQRMHMYWFSGYVVELSESIKAKPTFLLQAVLGAPLQWELSMNLLFYDRFQLGAAYRSSSEIVAIAGFQILDSWFVGVGYDRHVGGLDHYNDGGYELVLQFKMPVKRNRYLRNRFY